MTILALTLTAALTGLVISISLNLRKLAARHLASDQELQLLQARIKSAVILPDREGHFRLMTRMECRGGFGDGETRYVPLTHSGELFLLHWVTPDGVQEQEYHLTDQPDGTIKAKAATPSN